MAWLSARNACASARASAEVIHCDVPSAAAILPSRLVPSLATTYGRPVRRWNRYGVRTRVAAAAPGPTSTSTPAARSRRIPAPATRTSGSSIATTTRRTPASMSASAHGPVRPTCAQGSRVTTAVAPTAAGPAARNASTSACAPPGGCVAPSPTTTPSTSRTHPTHGFGAARRRAPDASCRARSIASSSRTGSSPSATSGNAGDGDRHRRVAARDGGGARGPLPSGL